MSRSSVGLPNTWLVGGVTYQCVKKHLNFPSCLPSSVNFTINETCPLGWKAVAAPQGGTGRTVGTFILDCFVTSFV